MQEEKVNGEVGEKLGSGGILAVRGEMFQESDGSDYTECCQRVE